MKPLLIGESVGSEKELVSKPLDINVDTMLVFVLHKAVEFGFTLKRLKKPNISTIIAPIGSRKEEFLWEDVVEE